MSPRLLLALAATALLVTSAASTYDYPASPASVALIPPEPRITGASTTPTSSARGLVILRAAGQSVERYSVAVTCPRGVFLKRGGSNLCGERRSFDDDDLRRMVLRLRNPNRATGTIAIAIGIAAPEMPVSSSTQQTVNLKLLGR